MGENSLVFLKFLELFPFLKYLAFLLNSLSSTILLVLIYVQIKLNLFTETCALERNWKNNLVIFVIFEP